MGSSESSSESLEKNEDNALLYLKTIKFKLTYIIISGSLFLEYISIFKNMENNISTAPKLIIFTSRFCTYPEKR